MRVNVYSQELTREVAIVRTVARDTGVEHIGVRLFLASSERLHAAPDDDDRSAVTFWVNGNGHTMDARSLAHILEDAADLLRSHAK